MLTPNWSPHSHPTAQKVCVCYSPVSKMRVLVPGREEQLLRSISRKELCLQLIQLLVICPAAPCFALGSTRPEVRKKAPQCSLPQYTLYLIRPSLELYVMQKNERNTTLIVKETLKSHLFLCRWGTHKGLPLHLSLCWGKPRVAQLTS